MLLPCGRKVTQAVEFYGGYKKATASAECSLAQVVSRKSAATVAATEKRLFLPASSECFIEVYHRNLFVADGIAQTDLCI